MSRRRRRDHPSAMSLEQMAEHNSISTPSPAVVEVEASHGTHVFEVENYSLHRGLCLNAFLRSPTFLVGGLAWAIRFYPGGCLIEKDPPDPDALAHSYIAVSIELMTRDAVAAVSFEIELVDDDATGARYTGTPTLKTEFDTRCVQGFVHNWIYSDFMKRSELEASPFLRGDRVVVQATLRVIKGTRAPEVEHMTEVTAPPSDLHEHLGRLLDDGHDADVTFEVQGESFPAHRAVLASRSPVFKAELHGQMKERSADHIVVGDVQPAVFRALLRFIYTDSLPATMDGLKKKDRLEITRHLLVAADRYAMDRLKLICAQILSKSLEVKNVCTTLALADRHNCIELKDACIEFIIYSNRMHDLVNTQGYACLRKSCPSVLLEVLEKAGNLGKI